MPAIPDASTNAIRVPSDEKRGARRMGINWGPWLPVADGPPLGVADGVGVGDGVMAM